MCEWTASDALRKHALAVEAAVVHYARMFGENVEEWSVVALLHDFDYERYPTLENHPFRGAEFLREQGWPEWVVHAVLSHADHTNTPRETRLEHTLFACDEMAGFVTAASLVRPSKSVLDLEASSVIKRMKDKAFARAVNRDDLRKGAAGAGPAARRPHHQRDCGDEGEGGGAGVEGDTVVRQLGSWRVGQSWSHVHELPTATHDCLLTLLDRTESPSLFVIDNQDG